MGTHRVEQGETLSGIAEAAGVSLQQLRLANPQILNPKLIFVGQEITIPGTATNGTTAPAAGQSVHVVEQGETLSAIAGRFGVSLDELLQANPQIFNPNLIFPGQPVTIPGTNSSAPGSAPVVNTGQPVDDMTPNAFIGFAALFPRIQFWAAQHGADARVMAAIVRQESGFTNFRVHLDGTGHGLIGLDDHGLLPDFEATMGFAVGSGSTAKIIPPELQMDFLARTLADFASRRDGDFLAAARRWHRGPGLMNDAAGFHYQALIEGHIKHLFG